MARAMPWKMITAGDLANILHIGDEEVSTAGMKDVGRNETGIFDMHTHTHTVQSDVIK